jgi:3-hydroxy-9,10-secoandrosta-1,3,5(10)-triene-9,17-dione monooxygenase reductase component
VECAIRDEHDAGDHTIVVGSVLALEAAGAQRDPLVFYRGEYGTFLASLPQDGVTGVNSPEA